MSLLWLILVVPPGYILNWGQKRVGYYSKVEQYPTQYLLYYVISPNFKSVDPSFGAKRRLDIIPNGIVSIIYVIFPNFKSVDHSFGAKKGLDIIPISGYYSTLELYLYASKQKTNQKTRKHHYIFIYNHVAFFVCLFVSL